MKFQKKWLTILLAGILILALDGILIAGEYGHYQEKYQMAAILLEEEHGASEILKNGNFPSFEEARQTLARYGYEGIRSSFFGNEFLNHSIWILGGSAVFFLFLVFLIFYTENRQKKEQDLILNEICRMLEEFRNGNFRTNLLWEHLEDDQIQRKNIYMQMESLGSYFETLKDQAYKEKENTKSLVTDISHQLKTPIAALKACLEILEQEDLTQEERREFLKRCKDQMTGLELMSAALIQISRMETGMIELQIEKKRIFDTVLGAVNRILPKAETKEMEIELDIPDSLQTAILPHDSKWMGEALMNLLENAVKYSQQNGRIRVAMERWMSFVKIYIEDDGIGIPKEEQHKIFQRFYRGSSKKVRQEQGTGIGLFLTREIIDRHYGTIKVVSDDKKKKNGSIFQIQLPISENA